MRVDDLTGILGLDPLSIAGSFDGFSIDTRSLKSGQVYIAIKGEQFDGHDFVAQAQALGAAAVIVSREVDLQIPQLLVKDTRAAMARIASYFRKQYSGPCVVLTGSNGKTTVKEMIAAILSTQGSVHSTRGNFNNDLGLPLSLFELTPQHDFAVFEIGTNHPGEINYLADIAKPTVALVNNVANAHIEYFADISDIAKEKSDIYRSLSPNGIAIVNADDPFESTFRPAASEHQILSFAIHNKADVKATDIHFNSEGFAQFTLSYANDSVAIQLPVVGQHNIMNALAAATCAVALNIPLTDIKNGLELISAVKGRCRPFTAKCGARVFDDTYNANPRSALAAIELLSHFRGEKIFVLGDMGELGSTAETLHAEIGQQAKALGINRLYTVGKISEAASTAFGENGFHFTNKQELMADLIPQLTAEQTLIIKGSRSMKMEELVAAIEE